MVPNEPVVQTPCAVQAEHVDEGARKFARFRMLNVSARNCSFARSPRSKFLLSETSNCQKGIPRAMLRPALPKGFDGSSGMRMLSRLKYWTIWLACPGTG